MCDMKRQNREKLFTKAIKIIDIQCVNLMEKKNE